MTPKEVLQLWTPRVRQVPPVDTPNTCHLCLGPSNPGYNTCYRCAFDWRPHPEYAGACDLIVPATVVVQPSDWYSAVYHYKSKPNYPAFAPVLAVVLREWLAYHAGRVVTALGGPPDLAAVVPSRKVPPPTPLYSVAEWAVRNTPALAGLGVDPTAVAFAGGSPPAKHRTLSPESLFAGETLTGRRVLLVEDTWVSGSTALSTAIALRRAGAAGVALISIARMVKEGGMTPEYEQAAAAPIDFAHWPR